MVGCARRPSPFRWDRFFSAPKGEGNPKLQCSQYREFGILPNIREVFASYKVFEADR